MIASLGPLERQNMNKSRGFQQDHPPNPNMAGIRDIRFELRRISAHMIHRDGVSRTASVIGDIKPIWSISDRGQNNFGCRCPRTYW